MGKQMGTGQKGKTTHRKEMAKNKNPLGGGAAHGGGRTRGGPKMGRNAKERPSKASQRKRAALGSPLLPH